MKSLKVYIPDYDTYYRLYKLVVRENQLYVDDNYIAEMYIDNKKTLYQERHSQEFSAFNEAFLSYIDTLSELDRLFLVDYDE